VHSPNFIKMRDTNISAVKAKEYIDNYRLGLPAGSLRSCWLNRDIIDAIIELENTAPLNGLRVYLAKYTEDLLDGKFKEGDITLIAVPTVLGIVPGTGIDVATAFYDYSSPCPPHCDGDGGHP
jgi:hypothetical protein